jgi:serine/threonine protein phosphatase PrpC
MPFKIATAAASPRKNSEDRLAAHHVQGGIVVVVADGAGGMGGGAAAADLVLAIVEHALGDPHFNPFAPTSWENVLVEGDAEIERDRGAGETTAVIIAVTDDGRIVGASVGDSGALLIRSDGNLDDLTENQHRKRRLGSGRVTSGDVRAVGS